ncbi:MAG: transcriptional regulator [Chloroflexi bacterium]|nr:transcriptional regulator [Chloroflexota bacterium]
MRTNIVLTLTGKDRVGIVEQVTQILLDLGGNVEASQMARLGGEFAILILVSLPSEKSASLEDDVRLLMAHGYKVTATQTELTPPQAHPGWRPYRIQVHGADHEGIIHEIAHSLSQRGINIETLETGTHRAPISGSPLFTMSARVVVPPNLSEGWQADLVNAGRHLNVEVVITAVESE